MILTRGMQDSHVERSSHNPAVSHHRFIDAVNGRLLFVDRAGPKVE